jgi:hypothetical protein
MLLSTAIENAYSLILFKQLLIVILKSYKYVNILNQGVVGCKRGQQ